MAKGHDDAGIVVGDNLKSLTEPFDVQGVVARHPPSRALKVNALRSPVYTPRQWDRPAAVMIIYDLHTQANTQNGRARLKERPIGWVVGRGTWPGRDDNQIEGTDV